MAKFVVTFTETITHVVSFESDLALDDLSKNGKWYRALEKYFEAMSEPEYEARAGTSENELVERELNEIEELQGIDSN